MIKAEWTNKDSLDLQPTCNQLATTEGDLIYRADAINCIKWGEGVTDVIGRIKALPSAEPLVLTCDGCRHVGTYDTDFPCSGCIRREKDYYEPEE